MNYHCTNIKSSKSSTYGIIGILSAFIFCSIYGFKILNPMYTDWLLAGGDLSQHYLGWVAYRESAWHFPIGMADTLAYPNLTSIIFTDSIPVFAVFFKLLSPILPSSFQYFGLWGIMCFVLQGILSARILKKYITNNISLIISSLIFVYTPVMLWRMYEHTALAGQWILLLGLEPLFSYKKYANSSRLYITAAIIGILSPLIHIYFVLMNGIILFGICFLDIIGYKRIKQSLLTLTAYLTTAILITYLFGGFSSDMQATNGGLGLFSFNLNAFFNPQGWSCIFQELPLRFSQQYEGFGYLGAGCILLLVFSLTLFMGNLNAPEQLKKHWKEAAALILISIITILCALSPVITLEDKTIIELKLPELITKCWSIFRASGRIIWIAIYIIMLCSCILLSKLLNLRTLLIILSFGFVLQTYDLHNMLISKHENFSKPKEYISELTSAAFWDTIAADTDIKHIVYFSSVSQPMMYSITDWALSNQKTVNNFYFARSISDEVTKNRDDSLNRLSDSDLFIFQNSEQLNCLKYNLHYYDIDGLVVGYVNKIDGFPEMALNELSLIWNFGNNQYMTEGAGTDTENGRELYADGLSYGPYWYVPKGNYNVIITGIDIPEELDTIIYSHHGELYHDFEIRNRTDSEISIDISFDTDIEDLEICLKNNTKETVLLKGVEINYNGQ